MMKCCQIEVPLHVAPVNWSECRFIFPSIDVQNRYLSLLRHKSLDKQLKSNKNRSQILGFRSSSVVKVHGRVKFPLTALVGSTKLIILKNPQYPFHRTIN